MIYNCDGRVNNKVHVRGCAVSKLSLSAAAPHCPPGEDAIGSNMGSTSEITACVDPKSIFL